MTPLMAAAVLLAAFLGDSLPPQCHRGITASVTVSEHELPMGARVELQVGLRFVPSASDTTALRLHHDWDRWRFVFTGVDNAAQYIRDPYDVGMPFLAEPDNWVSLGAEREIAFPLAPVIYLVSPLGEQIPPGEYDLRAIYSNDAPGDDARPQTEDPGWWSGEVASKPVRVTIVPAEAREVVVQVPSTLVVERRGEQISCGWDVEDRSVAIWNRPGYAMGKRYQVTAYLDHEKTNYQARRTLGIGRRGAHRLMLPPDLSARAFTGEALEIVVTLELFESSVQPQHLWNPEYGDCKVLWRVELRSTYQ